MTRLLLQSLLIVKKKKSEIKSYNKLCIKMEVTCLTRCAFIFTTTEDFWIEEAFLSWTWTKIWVEVQYKRVSFVSFALK